MRPRALDLFCGAGGASMGLHRAGFEVTGVDIAPQPRYPFEFIQSDWENVARTLPGLWQRDGQPFVVWASPPCQRYSAGAGKWGTQGNHPDLIDPVREVIEALGVPFVIENIVPAGSRLRSPTLLCGTMFGLGVFRHRLFETSFPMFVPGHPAHTGKIGDGKYCTVTGHAGGSSKRDGWKNGGVAEWRVAMGIEWMVGDELAEAIPPDYAEFVGQHAMKALLNGEGAWAARRGSV